MDEELELAAVPAEDAAAPGHVTDDEFEEWVRRSQEQTDSVLEGWDHSVAYEQAAYGDAGMSMQVDVVPERPEDVGLVEAVIYNEDGSVFEPPAPTPWQELARRMRAGEELGAEFRQEILGSISCQDPGCPVCAEHARAIDGGQVPALPAWALEVAQRFIEQRPGERIVVSMPRRQSPWAVGFTPAPMPSWAFSNPYAIEQSRRNLELMGFRIIEDRPAPGTLFSILGGQVATDTLEDRIRRELAAPRTPPAPTRHSSVWSIQEIMGPIALQRRATFRTL